MCELYEVHMCTYERKYYMLEAYLHFCTQPLFEESYPCTCVVNIYTLQSFQYMRKFARIIHIYICACLKKSHDIKLFCNTPVWTLVAPDFKLLY